MRFEIAGDGSRFECEYGIHDSGVGKMLKLVGVFVEGFTSEQTHSWTTPLRGNTCASGTSAPEDGETG
jgi:hypothetical protein